MKKKENKRKEILETAAMLFSQRGYDNTSTRDIANAVSISSPSLYYHFKSKGAILMELLKEPMDYIEFGMTEVSTLPKLKRVRRIVELLLTAFEFHNGILIVASNHSKDISELDIGLIKKFESETFEELTNQMTVNNKKLRIVMAIGAIEKVVKELTVDITNQSDFSKHFKLIKEELIDIVMKIITEK